MRDSRISFLCPDPGCGPGADFPSVGDRFPARGGKRRDQPGLADRPSLLFRGRRRCGSLRNRLP